MTPDKMFPSAPCCNSQKQPTLALCYHFICCGLSLLATGPTWPRWPAAQTPLKPRQHESGYKGEATALYSEIPVSSLML